MLQMVSLIGFSGLLAAMVVAIAGMMVSNWAAIEGALRMIEPLRPIPSPVPPRVRLVARPRRLAAPAPLREAA